MLGEFASFRGRVKLVIFQDSASCIVSGVTLKRIGLASLALIQSLAMNTGIEGISGGSIARNSFFESSNSTPVFKQLC